MCKSIQKKLFFFILIISQIFIQKKKLNIFKNFYLFKLITKNFFNFLLLSQGLSNFGGLWPPFPRLLNTRGLCVKCLCRLKIKKYPTLQLSFISYFSSQKSSEDQKKDSACATR